MGCVGDIHETSQNSLTVGATCQGLVTELEEVGTNYHGVTDSDFKVALHISRWLARVGLEDIAPERRLLRVGTDAPLTAQDRNVKVSELVNSPIRWVVIDVVGHNIAILPRQFH